MTLRRTLRNINGKNCIEQSPAMQEFGVQIEKQTACLPARILEEPKLAYAQNVVSSQFSYYFFSHKHTSGYQCYNDRINNDHIFNVSLNNIVD